MSSELANKGTRTTSVTSSDVFFVNFELDILFFSAIAIEMFSKTYGNVMYNGLFVLE